MAIIPISEAQSRSYDICVLGAGAAGLALARSLHDAGMAVLVVEKGDLAPPPTGRADDEPVIGTDVPHDPRARTNRDGVGGSLHGWGGRCMPYDPEDFAPDAIANLPGWPISYDDYAAWVEPASTFLESDPVYTAPVPAGWDKLQGVRIDRVETLNALRHVDHLVAAAQRASHPDVLTGAVATGLRWGDHGDQITGVELQVGDSRAVIAARGVVLACGGLETTRFLLEEQARRPALMGGPDGPLGRYYMGHLTGSVAEIHFTDAGDVPAFGYSNDPGTSPARRRFVLTQDTNTNTAFWVENLPLETPRHKSGERSFKHLIASRGRTPELGAHLTNMLRDPRGIADALASVSRRRLAPDRRHPDRLTARGTGPYRLAYHGEHFPLADSRVTLSQERDELGRRKLQIDFVYGDDTIWELVRAHHTLAKKLAASGLARLNLMPDDTIMAEEIAKRARDGYHQIGLTRMAQNPDFGVVDPDCRVFGVKNLFVASGAVFPTAGQANPSLSVVMLALRLADWIGHNRASLPPAPAPTPPQNPASAQ